MDPCRPTACSLNWLPDIAFQAQNSDSLVIFDAYLDTSNKVQDFLQNSIREAHSTSSFRFEMLCPWYSKIDTTPGTCFGQLSELLKDNARDRIPVRKKTDIVFDWLNLVETLKAIQNYDHSNGEILLQPSTQPVSQPQEHRHITLLKIGSVKKAVYEENGLKANLQQLYSQIYKHS